MTELELEDISIRDLSKVTIVNMFHKDIVYVELHYNQHHFLLDKVNNLKINNKINIHNKINTLNKINIINSTNNNNSFNNNNNSSHSHPDSNLRRVHLSSKDPSSQFNLDRSTQLQPSDPSHSSNPNV